MIKTGRAVITIIYLLLLSSCAIDTTSSSDGDFGKKVAPPQKDFFDFSTLEPKANNNASLEAISVTASAVNASIMQLEKIERYRKPRIINVADENMKKYNLGHKVQVDWSGPIEPLISEIAAFSNYRLKIVGVAPAIPVLVDVSHQNVAIGDIIREVHLQAKERANLIVFPNSKTIELRYNEIG